MHHLHPIFKMFPGKAPGSNLQEGVHSRSFPQMALRADLVTPTPKAVDPLDSPLLEVRFAIAHLSDLNQSR